MLMRFFLFNMMMSNTFLASAIRISRKLAVEAAKSNRLSSDRVEICLQKICT